MLTQVGIANAFKREIKNVLYKELLLYSLNHAAFGTLAIRPHLSISPQAKDFLSKLSLFQMELSNDHQWKDAQLFDSSSELIKFSLTIESVSLLLSVSSSIFQWAQPGLPEDLCLFKADNSDWLITMAHTKRGFLVLNRQEKLDIIAAIPKFGSILI